jgi:hypothetical protein
VAALNSKAGWFQDQAARAPASQLDLWQEALAHVRRTIELIGASAPDDQTRRTVDRILANLDEEQATLRQRADAYRKELEQKKPTTEPAAQGDRSSSQNQPN